jgi:hypothetical protein
MADVIIQGLRQGPTAREYFDCQCEDAEHTLRCSFEQNEDDPNAFPELWTEVHLNSHLNFWGRLKAAVKYLFGVESRYGMFGTWLLIPEDAARLRNLVDRFQQAYDAKRPKPQPVPEPPTAA